MEMSDRDEAAPAFGDDGGLDHASGLQSVADRHGVGLDAVRHVMRALERGHGTMAQFDHPDLGGMGQWFSGGMTMVGRMFDDRLRARVDALCAELAAALPAGGWSGDAPGARGRDGGEWWPADLGRPSTAGSQDGMRYAYFPEARRLAIETGAGIDLYDTGEHRISGVSQSNGSLGFSGPTGTVDPARLRRIERESAAPRQADPAEPAPRAAASAAAASNAAAIPPATQAPAARSASGGPADVIATIERLAELHARGILTGEEFAAKKSELLARL